MYLLCNNMVEGFNFKTEETYRKPCKNDTYHMKTNEDGSVSLICSSCGKSWSISVEAE